MTDLFQYASGASAPSTRSTPLPAKGLDALRPSGHFEQHRKAALFVHHCAKCGSVYAPFGFRCHIGAAMDSRDPRKAGIWLCRDCNAEVLEEEMAA